MELKADSRSLASLHDDVVFEIFKWLSLPERKNARLVCKQWHRVSNRRIFAEREAFFVSNMYNIRSLVQVLVKCPREILNLKFDQRIFGPSSNVLWGKCGRRIQSLQFYLCVFSPDIVKRIFINCKNLNEFTSRGGGVMGFYPGEENLPRQKSILQINTGVVRSKLRTLNLGSEALALRECDLRLISSAFPQLNSLKIRLHLSEDEEIRDTPNFTVLLNLLDSGLKNLEKLDVEFLLNDEFEPIDFASVSQFNLDRLKNVSMLLRPFILSGDSLTRILNYKFWRSFRVSWCDPYDTGMTVLTRLINENPLLEKFSVHLNISLLSVSEFSNLFKALVKSRLKSLTVDMSDYYWPFETVKLFITLVTSSLEGLPCNDTVEYLNVNSERSAEFSSLFVKYFRSIRYLQVIPGNVNTIFEYQKNLKSLRIQPIGAIRTNVSPARRSIESLELMVIHPLALGVFTAYQFPNLKYLIINDSRFFYDGILQYESGEPAYPNVNEDNGSNAINLYDFEREGLTSTIVFIRRLNKLMSNIFGKSPHLEAIQFDCDYKLDAEAFDVFFQSCLHFHQLRYVSIHCCSPDVDEMALKHEVVKYFKKCPSFRGLWLDTVQFNVAYYFNTVTKKYEFSNEFSKDFSESDSALYFAVNLPEFWRYKQGGTIEEEC